MLNDTIEADAAATTITFVVDFIIEAINVQRAI